MARANRCPQCKETIHPFAALCPSCGADLDAWRRRQREQPARRVRVSVPTISIGNDLFDLLILSGVLLLLALFTPLIGAVLAFFLIWHAQHYGPVARRNVAIFFCALALYIQFAANGLLPHVL